MASKIGIGIGGFALGFCSAMLWNSVSEDPDAPQRLATTEAGRHASSPEAALPEPGAQRNPGESPRPTPTAPKNAPLPAATYLQRINEVPLAQVPHVGIRRLSKEDARDILEAIFSQIEDPARRAKLLEALLRDSENPYLPQMAHLGATDPEPSVRLVAFRRIATFAFVDFTEDPSAYPAWWKENGGQPLDATIRKSALDLLERLPRLEGMERARQFEAMGRFQWAQRAVPELPRLMREAGAIALVERWLQIPDPADPARRVAFEWIRSLEPDVAWSKRVLLPIVRDFERHDLQLVTGALYSLASEKYAWALDTLLDVLPRLPAENSESFRAIGQALAAMNSKRAVKPMIDRIIADNTYKTISGLGYFGLSRITEVSYHESHDGPWWREWWQRNGHLYAE